MKDHEILHILRNPYGHSEEDKKTARLETAQRITELKAALNDIIIGFDISGYSGYFESTKVAIRTVLHQEPIEGGEESDE